MSNGGVWQLLGTFPMAANQNHRAVLTNMADGIVVADAVGFQRVGSAPPAAVFAPAIPARDEYEVYVRWVHTSGRATDAPYVVFREGGSTTIRVNQADNVLNGTWVPLGTFIMAPGQGHRVELRDDANGTVEADAVRFLGKPVTKTATWTLSAAQTANHRVYAKWPASNLNPTNAVFAVTHGGGTTNVTVNQRVNGGQWVLLGTFPFTSGGAGYKVTLMGNSIGRAAADAVHMVAEPVVTDAFTWTPAIPGPGSYQLYARWTASSANTAAAGYTIVHGGGSQDRLAPAIGMPACKIDESY